MFVLYFALFKCFCRAYTMVF